MDEKQSSNEIRADIDETRAAVGSKIDQLQARLDPNRLKDQAAETVQEMLSDTANSMTEYVRTHKDEMVASVTEAARRNPVPTALVGLGLGWLILESMAGNRHDDDRTRVRGYNRVYDRDYDRGYEYERSGFAGSTGRSVVSQGRGQYTEGEYYSPEYYDTANYGSSYGRSGYAAGGATGYGGDFTSGEHDEQDKNPVAKAADAVKDKVTEVGSEIKERVQNMGEEARHQVDRMGQQTQRRFDENYDRAGNRMQEMRHETGHQMNEWRHDAGHQMNEWRRGAGDQMHEWRDRARYEGRRRGRQFVRNLEDNPLTYGAVALAAGAALALLLPQTRMENRTLGRTRDELMDRGQEALRTAQHHAQEVIEEVRPEVEQKAREIIHDVKETGKQAAKDAAEEMRPVVDKAIAKGKEEARSAAQESGIDPDKLQGKQSNKPAINRDTMKGQWKQIQGEFKSQWGKLTDDDMTRIEGDYEKLVGSIQTRYGYTRERSEQEVNDFFKRQGSASKA